MICRLSLNDPIYFALFKLACKRRIVVFDEPFPENEKFYNGFYYRRESESDYDFIRLNTDRTVEQKTFTLAHELGHYALHKDEMGTKVWANYTQERGALLMLFYKDFTKFIYTRSSSFDRLI